MKIEGEYAVDKSEKYHRIASLIFVIIWVGLVFYNRGPVSGLRSTLYFFIPLACIWFPEAMATRAGLSLLMRSDVPFASEAVYLRWAGWCLLLMPLIIPLIVWMIF